MRQPACIRIAAALVAAAVVSWLAPGQARASELAGLDGFDARSAEIVILGEVHDNPLHHEAQAELVARLRPAAVVFEMLTPAQASVANALGTGIGEAALADSLDWENSGWPDFAMYFPVLTAGGDAPIYGAALPREDVRAAVGDGAATVFGADAGRFGLDRPLPEDEQSAREAGQAESHCDALPEELLPGFVEAQRLRDAHFARVALAALEETGGPVVVITGNGHARTDWGMPAALRVAAPEVRVLAFGQLEAEPDAVPPYDLWRVTAPPEREDPCAVFQ